jgi:GDP-4-dehydro-6-deoxy-D-mannose reductase
LRALVTGSHGFAGTHLRALLRERGHEVWGFDALAGEPGPGETFRPVDLTDAAAVRAGIDEADPDLVLHLAGRTGFGGEEGARAAVETNVGGVGNLLAALLDRGRPVRFLHVGSSAQYGDVGPAHDPVTEEAPTRPLGLYGWTKLAAEALAMSHHGRRGIEVLPVRPFNHTGPGEPEHLVSSTFAKQITAAEAGGERVIRVGNLDAVRDLADVRDIVRGYADLTERGTPGRPVNLCSGRGTRIRDVLETLVGLARVDVEIETDPSRARPAELARQVGSHARATADVGWEPATSLESSLGDLLDWWRQRWEALAQEGRTS